MEKKKEYKYYSEHADARRRTILKQRKIDYVKYKKSLCVLLISTLVISLYVFQKKYFFDKRKKSTTAVIRGFNHHRYTAFYLSGNINNYYVEYEYRVKNKVYISRQEILIEDYELYFGKELNKGDTIEIFYDTNKPKMSKIKKIN